ncbi:response regulator [Tranquillimonas alkanivorans]|uniref:response regulator n=1 Tax=Tranquillimonas alkanivorans TaxID=441119 RepID=UPI0015A686DD|nr:response regulator [Tranquillimonas alkanivorans]
MSRPSSEDTFRPGDPATLHGTRVLVVEDEHLVGQDTAEALRSAGCSTLGPIATVQEALRVAVSEDIDAAVLDINLNGDLVWPVARALKAREIPLVFTTGYADTVPAPRGLENVTRIEKPVEPDRLLARLSVEVTRKAHAAPTH